MDLEKLREGQGSSKGHVIENPFLYWALLLITGMDINYVHEGFKQAAIEYGFSEKTAQELIERIEL